MISFWVSSVIISSLLFGSDVSALPHMYISGLLEPSSVRGSKVGPTVIKCAEKNNTVDPMAGARGLQHLCLFGTDFACMTGFTAKVLRALTAHKREHTEHATT